MCRTAIYYNPGCRCRWVAVTHSCGVNMGLTTCPTFREIGVVRRGPPPTFKSRHWACPRHDLRGFYDRNMMRMVLGIENGLKIGCGPDSEDPGIEIPLGRCTIL